MPKTIPILIQYACAKLVVSWDKPYWPEVQYLTNIHVLLFFKMCICITHT